MNKRTKKKIVVWIRRNSRWIILFVCMILFFAIAEDILEHEIGSFDSGVYQFISQFISDPVTKVFKIITNFSAASFVIVVTLFILLLCKNKKIRKICGD